MILRRAQRIFPFAFLTRKQLVCRTLAMHMQHEWIEFIKLFQIKHSSKWWKVQQPLLPANTANASIQLCAFQMNEWMIEHSHPSRVLLDNINTIQNQVSRVTATMQFLNFQMRNANGRSIKDTIFFLLYFAFPSTLFHLQCGGKLFFCVSFYFYIVVIGSQFCILCANEITKLTYNVLRDTCCWAMAIAQDIHFNTYFSNSKLLYYNLFFSCSRAVFVNICLFCLVFYCHFILFLLLLLVEVCVVRFEWIEATWLTFLWCCWFLFSARNQRQDKRHKNDEANHRQETLLQWQMFARHRRDVDSQTQTHKHSTWHERMECISSPFGIKHTMRDESFCIFFFDSFGGCVRLYLLLSNNFFSHCVPILFYSRRLEPTSSHTRHTHKMNERCIASLKLNSHRWHKIPHKQQQQQKMQ